jgi:cytochrome P450
VRLLGSYIGAELICDFTGAGSGFEKSDFYLATLIKAPAVSWDFTSWGFNLTYEDSLDLLSDRDTKRYRSQRRTIGPTYTLSSLRKHEPALDEAIKRIMNALHDLHPETVDLKEWMHASVVECLGAVVLGGWSPKFLQLKTDCGTSAHAHMIWRRKSVMGLFPQFTILGLVSKQFSRMFSAAWGVRHGQPPNHRPFFPAVQRKLTKRINTAMSNNKVKHLPATVDLLDELIQLHKAKPESFTLDYLRRMAMTNFGAGHETMTSAMISALAMIGTHPEVQTRIHTELDAQAGQELSSSNVQMLPYTLAAIKEAQRLYPVIGMSLPRVVPAEALELHGYTFPPGTTVGCAPVALHRNASVFGPDADTYRPERWLEADLETKNTMERVNLTYGGGARSCPGKHLAELVVYKLVASILNEFDVVVDMPLEEDIRYYFLAMLTGTRVRFFPRVRA